MHCEKLEIYKERKLSKIQFNLESPNIDITKIELKFIKRNPDNKKKSMNRINKWKTKEKPKK